MSEAKAKVLLVEDDPGLQKQLKWSLDEYEIVTAGDRDAASAQLRRVEPAVVLLDLGWGFSWLVASGLARYETVYGSLGAVDGLLFWMYLSSFILLFGAHLTSAIDPGRKQHKP